MEMIAEIITFVLNCRPYTLTSLKLDSFDYLIPSDYVTIRNQDHFRLCPPVRYAPPSYRARAIT